MTRYLKNMEKEIIIDNQLDEVARIALFIAQILDSDKYSFFYAKCIGRMKHLLHGWQ